MEVSLQEAIAAISLQSIQAIKKEREKSIAKALSIPRWKEGKNIPPSKERHDNFQLQAFQCVRRYSTGGDIEVYDMLYNHTIRD